MTLSTARTTNWAGNVTFTAERVHRPASVGELQQLVAGADRVRALGTGHSFNRIADTTGDLVSVAGLPPEVDVDTAGGSVRVAAGLPYGTVARHLHAAGCALRNLGSLPHISVAGACATGTHGSGDRNGVLATSVSALELVAASGEVVSLGRDVDADRLRGAIVGLGSLGVVTSLTLDVAPTYDVRQFVYEDLPLAVLGDHLDEVFATGDSVSLFTDWRGAVIRQVWLKRRTDRDDGWTPEQRWLGATLADRPRHPIPGMSPENSTEQLGVPGPWHERLPFFRPTSTPSSGDELQSEYLLPRVHALPALSAVTAVREVLAPALQMSELRTVAADELWLSPAYRQDSLAVHFTWVRDPTVVAPAVTAVEAALAPFDARPHWGKVFSTPPEVVHGLYERLPDFGRLVADHDPTGKFANAFTTQYLSSS